MFFTRDLLKNKNINISLRYYGQNDLATGWEIQAIIENLDVFHELYSHNPLTHLYDVNDYYLYLLSRKLISMRDVVPILLHEEHKNTISSLSTCAEIAIASITIGEIVKFINNNIQIIFANDETLHDLQFVTLELIAKYINGISKDSFAYLCENYGFYLIERYDQFEKKFEHYPELFDSVYPTGHLAEVNSFPLEQTLHVWSHILKKENSCLKESVIKCVAVLAEDIKKMSETVSFDDIMQVERIIRLFYQFLQSCQNPKANEFFRFAKSAADLLSKSLVERGHSFQYEIPVDKIVSAWKGSKNWIVRLLCLTHDLKINENSLRWDSRLSKEPEAKHFFFDNVTTNIPTDDYFTLSHQQMLSIVSSVGEGTIKVIMEDPDTLMDYLGLIASAFILIIKKLNAEGEQLEQDIEMLSALVQIVANNSAMNNHALHGMCYGASMFLCSLAEKLLRILYFHLAQNEIYIPMNKATLGEILSVNNTYITSIFGEKHIKNLSFFLQQIYPLGIGYNIRNSLAHWANISTSEMTPFYVSKIIWIFTDIVNTVFLYCLEDEINQNSQYGN